MIGAALLSGCSLDRDPSHVVVVDDTRDAATIAMLPSAVADAVGHVISAQPVTADAGTGAPTSAQPVTADAGTRIPADSSTATNSSSAGATMPADACGGACPADRPHCLPDGTCAACASDADCGAELPRCDSATFTCVQCIGNLDCSELARPECSAHHCTRCTSDAACSARTATPVCDLGATGEDDDGEKHGKKRGRVGACVGASW